MNKKTVFITVAPFEKEIHNVLYAKELFIDKYLQEGYFVVAIVFCQSHIPLIEEKRSDLKVIYFQNSPFINKITSAIRSLLAHKNSPRFPFYMKKRWLGMRHHRSLKQKILSNVFLFFCSWLSENCLLYLLRKTLSRSILDSIYKTCNPFLTILPFYFSSSYETNVIAIAKNNKSLTVAIPARISAFDDVFYYTKPDLLLVWNELMKEQAIRWQGCSRNTIIPIGILKCDYYKTEILQAKEEFISNNKLADGRKIISIICGNISVARAYSIAKVLFESGEINTKFQILLRANPDDYERQLKELGENNKYPVFLFRGFSSNTKESKFREQIISTANFLKNSDLIISAASTMCLESLYFNIPNIFLAYEEFRRYYDYDSINQLANEAGIKIARNDRELIFAVKEYLENPFTDIKERNELFKKYCFSVNGDAQVNCFNEINQFLRSKDWSLSEIDTERP